MVKAALEAMRRHLVLQDKEPKVLAQLARLMKGDKMMQLTCKNNALQAKVEELDDLAYWKTDHKMRDGTTGEYKKLWSDIAMEEEIDRGQEFRAMQEEIEQRDRRIARLEAAIYMVKAKLTTARTEAGRAEFAAAASQCLRAEEHAKRTHELISESLMVLDDRLEIVH